MSLSSWGHVACGLRGAMQWVCQLSAVVTSAARAMRFVFIALLASCERLLFIKVL